MDNFSRVTCVRQTKGTYEIDGNTYYKYRTLDEILQEDVLPMIRNGEYAKYLNQDDGVELVVKVVPAPLENNLSHLAYRFAFHITFSDRWIKVEGDYEATPEDLERAVGAIYDMWPLAQKAEWDLEQKAAEEAMQTNEAMQNDQDENDQDFYDGQDQDTTQFY